MSYLIALLVGLAAGAHAATWGMYKDSVYEGFSMNKYLRSVFQAGGLAVATQWVLGLDMFRAGSLVILFGVTYVLERGLFEFYKVFIRKEDQTKYFIPMAFAVGGRIVQSQGLRWLAGAAYVVLIGAAFTGVHFLGSARLPLPTIVMVILVGSAVGWLSAFGGAWKDAPLEGFQLFKFFRSPAIAGGFAVLLSLFTTNYDLIALGALGFTIASIETYKKFFNRYKAPGKFEGKPVRHPEMYQKRKRFVPVYVSLWVLIGLSIALALVEPSQGIL
ncbi:MAG: hypothetical protein ABI836_13400 [Gemmatimonadota bacterium]